MKITEFFELSFGWWRSQGRGQSQLSGHHLAFAHFDEVRSTDDPKVLKICKSYNVDSEKIIHPFRMKSEGESDWDKEELSCNTVIAPALDRENPGKAKLLREVGYAQTIPLVGNYQPGEDGTFT